MKLWEKITDAYRNFTLRSRDRKLVREMARQMPEMMVEMDRMVAAMGKVNHSIGDIIAEARKYDHVITMPEQAAAPPVLPVLVEIARPPINTDDCTILQNPMNVPRQPIRVRKNSP